MVIIVTLFKAKKKKKTTSSHDTCKSFIELTASLKSRHPSDIKYDYYMFSSLFREVYGAVSTPKIKVQLDDMMVDILNTLLCLQDTMVWPHN